MEVITIETEAFYKLLEMSAKYIMEKHKEKPRWIPGSEAMKILNIK